MSRAKNQKIAKNFYQRWTNVKIEMYHQQIHICVMWWYTNTISTLIWKNRNEVVTKFYTYNLYVYLKKGSYFNGWKTFYIFYISNHLTRFFALFYAVLSAFSTVFFCWKSFNLLKSTMKKFTINNNL